MTACIGEEALSAYLDGEAFGPERVGIDRHLGDCSSCRARLRLLGRLQATLRLQAVAEMPSDLRRSLQGLVPSAPSHGPLDVPAASLWGALRSNCRWPVLAGVGGAAALALLFWPLRGRGAVPVELLLAAHRQYAVTLPLAQTECLASGLPSQLAAAEERSDD